MAKTGNGDSTSHLLAGCLAVTDLLRSLAVFFGHGLWHSTCRAHASPVVSSQRPTTDGQHQSSSQASGGFQAPNTQLHVKSLTPGTPPHPTETAAPRSNKSPQTKPTSTTQDVA